MGRTAAQAQSFEARVEEAVAPPSAQAQGEDRVGSACEAARACAMRVVEARLRPREATSTGAIRVQSGTALLYALLNGPRKRNKSQAISCRLRSEETTCAGAIRISEVGPRWLRPLEAI